MVPFHEIKLGDWFIVNDGGQDKEGEVTDINHDEKQICVDTEQEFWYEANEVTAIPLDDVHLYKLNFHRHLNEDGSVKYSKGAFRMVLPKINDFSNMEIWYRDERRHIHYPLMVHQLQNHFHEMTKVHLNAASFG